MVNSERRACLTRKTGAEESCPQLWFVWQGRTAVGTAIFKRKVLLNSSPALKTCNFLKMHSSDRFFPHLIKKQRQSIDCFAGDIDLTEIHLKRSKV